MFSLAWRARQWPELWGQVPRLLLAGVGSALGKVPLGNPGTTRVGIFTPTPVRPDLRALMERLTER